MNMTTTTQEIFKKYKPGCFEWVKLLTNLGEKEPSDKPVSLKDIFNSNGIRDAIWALQFFEYKEYCLFLADITEGFLPQFETICPEDNRPRKLIQSIRDHHAGKVSEEELETAAKELENNLLNDFIAGSLCCVAIFAAAQPKDIPPSDTIHIAMGIDTDLEWKVIEQLFRKYFCNNLEKLQCLENMDVKQFD